jgi:hypothetical protein
MKTRTIAAIAAVLVTSGALAIACGSSESENPGSTCDPSTQTCDDTGTSGETDNDGSVLPDTEPAIDTSFGDGPPGDGLVIVPDGYSPCLDGGYLCGPDGAIIALEGGVVACIPGSTQCTDCVDNDGDGLTDWMDPECTGPLDRDESSFATGIPGDNIDACKQDCWFDGNSGAGDDGCDWPGKCLVGSTDKKCPYDPVAAADPKQCPPPSKKCVDYCRPLTPKGCDCAGCCDIYTPLPDGGTTVHTVKLVAGCTTEALGDPTKCPVCAKIPECSNPCGKCEWCLGKTSLPPECFPPPPVDAGTDAPPGTDTAPPPDTGTSPLCPPPALGDCSPTKPCAAGQYCLTGCCIKGVT